MNDAYCEWMIKRKKPSYAGVVKGTMILLCVIALFFTMIFPLGIVALVVSGFASYLVFLNMDLEFEYLYLNGELTIDKIMGKKKRKRVWEGSMEQVQLVVPADSGMIKNNTNEYQQVYDCSSQDHAAKAYALIAQNGQHKIKIIFEPNDLILGYMKQSYSSKVNE